MFTRPLPVGPLFVVSIVNLTWLGGSTVLTSATLTTCRSATGMMLTVSVEMAGPAA